MINGEIEEFIICDSERLVYKPAIAHSITGCFVFESEILRQQLRFAESCKYLITTKAIGNYICKKTGLDLPSEHVYISYEYNGYSDFSKFENLWKDNNYHLLDESRIEESELRSIIIAYKVGGLLGEIHKNNMLHTDAHPGNFVVNEEELEVFAIDVDGFEILLRPPTAVECASDFLLLLPYQTPHTWAALRSGYINKLGDLAYFTINYIELGFESRLIVYINQKRFEEAISFLYDELEKAEEESDRRDLYSQIGFCYSKLMLTNEAIKYYWKSLTSEEKDEINSDNAITYYNLAVAYLKQENLKVGLSILKNIELSPLFKKSIDWKIKLHTYKKLAEVYVAKQNFTEGKKYLKEYLSMSKNNGIEPDCEKLEADLKRLEKKG
ncbi:MAG: hypothetical protein AAFY76_00845 [Cyanobacteria bacterium J06649_11]